jgi:choline/glycine/proline betaine transport protein
MDRIKTYLRTHTNPPVFLVSGGVVLVVVALASIYPRQFGETANAVQDFIATRFGWFYVLSTFGFLLFTVIVALSRWGR